jgi:predicted nucleic acid-binding protein
MRKILVDTNVLLDVLQDDPHWFDWSVAQLDGLRQQGRLMINAIIYAELAQRYPSRTQVDHVVKLMGLAWLELDRDSLYLAAQAFGVYKRRGGSKSNVLADFFIGAQALQRECWLLTRDAARYKTYFPDLDLICPAVN